MLLSYGSGNVLYSVTHHKIQICDLIKLPYCESLSLCLLLHVALPVSLLVLAWLLPHGYENGASVYEVGAKSFDWHDMNTNGMHMVSLQYVF